jgi:hypothetical protein
MHEPENPASGRGNLLKVSACLRLVKFSTLFFAGAFVATDDTSNQTINDPLASQFHAFINERGLWHDLRRVLDEGSRLGFWSESYRVYP